MKIIILSLLFLSLAQAGEINFGQEMKLGPEKINLVNFESKIKLNWLKTIKDPINLNYVVKAEIYPEDPNTLFLTLRGGGITLLDIKNPSTPKLIQHWNEKNLDMEGQDRLGNLFISIARKGEIFIFKILKNRKISKVGQLRIPHLRFFQLPIAFIIPALHTRIYRDKKENVYALITCPWSKKLVSVDITNPKHPEYISSIKTDIKGVEGIQIYKDHAYLGGFRSNFLKVYNISDPKNMHLVQTLHDEHFSQMVPEMNSIHPDVLFTALWGKPGGLAAFSLKEPNKIKLLSKVIATSFNRANRVKIRKNLALLPLEEKVGGIGIVNIGDPKNLKLELSMTNIPGVLKPYTLNFKDNYVYLFGSETNSMAILRFTHD
ncbi:MAG: hypothetical protein DRQ88_03445 [Epsilonproteobacteria bacterium]|nr:MAG: hypothetical protein DRQ89_01315 [Campylobacterota bacterium]RLA67374.1 MAG: hypothetical protein DRQ88_03445 [Campylobacterota bacterium]